MKPTRRSALALIPTVLAARPKLALDERNRELAHPKTHFPMRAYSNRRDWEARRSRLRRQILSAAGLLPMPERHHLPPRVVRQDRCSGYATEVVLLETLPGYFVGGTVYRPVDGAARRPAVLIPHGHWKRGRVEHLPSYSVPALGINLALQGYVAFAWDMAGYNDTTQTRHSFSGERETLWGFNPLGLQLWNSICAVDYVAARHDVDPRRLACTGASGGATQTILLTAVDDRVACSAPVNMISAHYQGADPCEEAPNLRLDTNNVEIAALMAPRPMLMVSCTGDWTKNTPSEEFPAVQRVYSLYDHVANVENAHFDADHNYNAATRGAVYSFFARRLRTGGGELRDVAVEGLDTSALLAFPNDGARPAEALKYDALFEQWRTSAERLNRTRSEPALREQLQYAIAAEWPRLVVNYLTGEYVLLSRQGHEERIPGRWIPGRGDAVVVIHPGGSEAALGDPAFAAWRTRGRPVLSVDVFQTGRAEAPRDRGGRWFLSYNQTDDALRVQDILTALSFAHSLTARVPTLVGLGAPAGLWCLFAAAIAPFHVELHAGLRGFEGTDDEFRKQFYVPCIQRAGGLQAALRLTGRGCR